MASIDIYVDDYLYEASDNALKDEVKRRAGRPGWHDVDDPLGVHPWTRRGMADDIRQAFYARNSSRLELLLSQLELREIA
jgi:hypothetical protein